MVATRAATHSPPAIPRAAHAERIRALGARATPARVAVLRLLTEATRALSHHDIEAALTDAGFDRVTLYRVLDWMVEAGLAHRITDAERVFRFSLAAASAPIHTEHAHFRCEACQRVYCLEDVTIQPPSLPRGFHSRSVDLSIAGTCADCDDSNAPRSPKIQYRKPKA